jgi:hypothetical protein
VGGWVVKCHWGWLVGGELRQGGLVCVGCACDFKFVPRVYAGDGPLARRRPALPMARTGPS